MQTLNAKNISSILANQKPKIGGGAMHRLQFLAFLQVAYTVKIPDFSCV
ncbi:MAG: hypothetical protein LH649_17460 [Pseudanabaena sp. CAN_BIN31]|nr:hypothetical protein [Pseudanabaena sp. CAN_BIN31]